MVDAVLEGVAALAEGICAAARVGDTVGPLGQRGDMPAGFKSAYQSFVEGG